jgi:hypothetical protein
LYVHCSGTDPSFGEAIPFKVGMLQSLQGGESVLGVHDEEFLSKDERRRRRRRRREVCGP